MMTNSTLGEEVPNRLVLGICGLMVASLGFDVFCLLTIMVSRKNLLFTELNILFSIQAFVFVYKVISIALSFGLLAERFVLGVSTCAYLYPWLFGSSTGFNTILIYYSIWHFSALRSNRLSQVLFIVVRNVAYFRAFLIMVVGFVSVAMASLVYVLRDQIVSATTTPIHCQLVISAPATLLAVCLSNAPLVIVILVYAVSVFQIVLKCRQHSIGIDAARKDRKILKLSLKFLSFICIPVLAFVCRLTVPVVAPLLSSVFVNIFTRAAHVLIFSTFVLEPIVLTYIHNILYLNFSQTFLQPVFNFFAYLKYISSSGEDTELRV